MDLRPLWELFHLTPRQVEGRDDLLSRVAGQDDLVDHLSSGGVAYIEDVDLLSGVARVGFVCVVLDTLAVHLPVVQLRGFDREPRDRPGIGQ